MCFIMGDQGKTHHKSLIIRSLFRVSPGAALHRHAKLSTRRVTNWISFNNGAIKTLEPVCPAAASSRVKTPGTKPGPGCDTLPLVTCVGAGVVDARVVAVIVRGLPAVQLDHAGLGDVDLIFLVSAAARLP